MEALRKASQTLKQGPGAGRERVSPSTPWPLGARKSPREISVGQRPRVTPGARCWLVNPGAWRLLLAH